MGILSRQWPRATSSTPGHFYDAAARFPAPRRVLGISLRAVTSILAVLVFWNAIILVMGIAISAAQGRPRWEGSAAGQNRYEYADSYHVVEGTGTRAGIVFMWCTVPFVALALAVVSLLLRNSLTVRLAAFAAAAGTTVYVLASILWVECAYHSSYATTLYPVCSHEYDGKWFAANWRNPLAIIWVVPWFGVVSAVCYAILFLISLIALRRQRKQRKAEEQHRLSHGKSVSLPELREPSKEYYAAAEMGTRSISEMEHGSLDGDNFTLPSRTVSTGPSRHLSLADHAASPPTYSDGGDSLLTVHEKGGEKGA